MQPSGLPSLLGPQLGAPHRSHTHISTSICRKTNSTHPTPSPEPHTCPRSRSACISREREGHLRGKRPGCWWEGGGVRYRGEPGQSSIYEAEEDDVRWTGRARQSNRCRLCVCVCAREGVLLLIFFHLLHSFSPTNDIPMGKGRFQKAV